MVLATEDINNFVQQLIVYVAIYHSKAAQS